MPQVITCVDGGVISCTYTADGRIINYENMKILELIWYTYFRFSRYTCRRDEYNAKWVATSMTASLLTFILYNVLLIFLHYYKYSLFVDYFYSWSMMVIAILMQAFCIYFFWGKKKVSQLDMDNFSVPDSEKRMKYISIVSWSLIIGAFALTMILTNIWRPFPVGVHP